MKGYLGVDLRPAYSSKTYVKFTLSKAWQV